MSALLIARCAESTAAECGHRDGKKEQSNKPREAASLRAEEHPLSVLKITVREASGALLLLKTPAKAIRYKTLVFHKTNVYSK